MPKRKRAVPMEEGVLKIIYDKFLRPLIYYKPDDMTLREWHDDYLFQLKFRDIVTYTARRDFLMPGLFWDAPLRKIQGLGARKIKTGTLVDVRKDIRDTTYDIEFFGGQGLADQIFTLSEREWNSIAAYLEAKKD